MFVCNLKVNKKKFMKMFKIIIMILAIIIMCFSVYKILYSIKKVKESNSIRNIEVTSDNYTNFLKDCHENIDKYVGDNITITGYVYRLPDFDKNQFVVARTMLFDNNNQAVIVGILCNSDSIKDFDDYDWITVEGTIEKCNYKGDMPIIKVNKIAKSSTPEKEFVQTPSD